MANYTEYSIGIPVSKDTTEIRKLFSNETYDNDHTFGELFNFENANDEPIFDIEEYNFYNSYDPYNLNKCKFQHLAAIINDPILLCEASDYGAFEITISVVSPTDITKLDMGKIISTALCDLLK